MSFNLNFIQDRNLVIIFLLIFSVQLNAQTSNKYKLLWKIEGKKLTKPSYLFGTMHIDDARAFNFSDAVLPAIENTEKFALEVQPDSLMGSLFNEEFTNGKKAHLTFKKLLNEKEYKKLSKRFLDVNGYPIEESIISDPDIFLMTLQPDEDKDSDKSNFVDMHLYAHAKTMRKKIVGLEKLEDQMNLFKSLDPKEQRKLVLDNIKHSVSKYKRKLEEMTKIYLTGDIDAIDDYISSYDGYDYELERRNKVMCKSIIKEIQESSLFSAVGAAHLPGEHGLIKLLQKEGYTVTPVEAKFTGVAETYTIDDSKMIWQTFNDADLGYSVKVPGTVSSEENNQLKINTCIDYTTLKYYSFFSIDTRKVLKIDTKEALLERVINNTLDNYKAKNVERSPITMKTASGYEITIEIDNQDSEYSAIRSFYLIENDIFYQFFVLGSLEDVKSSSADKFFGSIVLYEPKPLPEINTDWIDFTSEKGAFSIDFPGKPKDISRKVDTGIEGVEEKYLLNMYMVSDIKKGHNYIVRYNDLPIGYRIEFTETFYESISQTLLNRAKLIGEPKDITYNGYSGREYELLINDEYHSICKVFFRGNRTYLLLSQTINEGEKTDSNNRFFESFKFNDYETEPLEEITLDEFSFRTLKNKKVLPTDEEDYSDVHVHNSTDHYSKDDNTGNMYSFGYSKLKPYFKIDTLKNFYEENAKGLVSWNDSIVSEKMIEIDGKEAFEFYIYNKKSKIKSRHVEWLDNDYFFMSSAYTSPETLDSGLTNEVLKSYKSLKSNQTIDYYAPKTNALLKDLKSKDSIVFKNALGAFGYYSFDKKDLKQLYKATNVKYKSVENRAKIIDAVISELNETNDVNTLSFLESLYSKKGINDTQKGNILRLIPKLKNKTRMDVYKNLLFKSPPKEKRYDYSLFFPLRDSIPFAIANYETFIGLGEIQGYRDNVLNISTEILKSEEKNKESILSYTSKVTNKSNKDVEEYVSMLEEEEYDYSKHSLIYSYLNYFDYIPTLENNTLIDSFTKRIVNTKSNTWLVSRAAQVRIKHNLKLTKSMKLSLLDSLDTRYNIIKSYHGQNRLNEVPKRYLTKEAFETLSLDQYLYDADEYPNKKNRLGTLEADEKEYAVYDLAYETEDGKSSYIILVDRSHMVSQEKPLDYYDVITDWSKLEKDWKTQARQVIIDNLEKSTD